MKKIFGLLALSTLLVSCEKDLTTENPAPDDKNVLVATSFIYGEEGGIHPDSLLTNNLGYGFFITDIQLVITHFFFIENGDTVSERKDDPFIVSLEETDEYLVYMEPRGYSGYYGFTYGYDSIKSFTVNPTNLPAGNELRNNTDLFRDMQYGIDHVVITGKLLDPADPLDSIGNIPFQYRLGTDTTMFTKTSLQQNFALMRNSDVKFVMEVDLEPIFNDLDIEAMREINTDLTVPKDVANAIDMADSLKIGLF